MTTATAKIKTQAIRAYFWIKFHKGDKKRWFHLFLPLSASDDVNDLEKLEEYLVSHNHILDLQSDVESQAYGAYNWNIKRAKIVDYEFQFRENFEWEVTDSPNERNRRKRQNVAVANIKEYPIDVTKTEIEEKGSLVYDDPLFGKQSIDLGMLKDLLNNPKEFDVTITDDDMGVILSADSSKVEATGLPPYNRGVADMHIHWALTKEEREAVERDNKSIMTRGVGDASLFIYDDGHTIVLVSQHRAVRINVDALFRKAVFLAHQAKTLDFKQLMLEGPKEDEKKLNQKRKSNS
jgi:hypothetical protein